MLIKSGQTANHRRQFLCKKTLLQSQKNQKVCHCTAIDWKSEQWQGSVFDRTYLACLQTRPIYPQYMLILEHTSGHCRFITEGVDTYWHMYICLFIHSHVSTNNIEKTDIYTHCSEAATDWGMRPRSSQFFAGETLTDNMPALNLFTVAAGCPLYYFSNCSPSLFSLKLPPANQQLA